MIVPPAMTGILQSPDNRVQGFLGPGHVCAVMGWEEYEPIAARYGVPIVITGFEPLDLLEGILMTVRQLEQGRAEVENQYARAVTREGNVAARRMIERVFEISDRGWRGIGTIPMSGYKLRSDFRGYDADRIFDVGNIRTRESGDLHQRAGAQGIEEAERVSGVRLGMHAPDAAGRHDGVGGRGLRGLLQLRAAPGICWKRGSSHAAGRRIRDILPAAVNAATRTS